MAFTKAALGQIRIDMQNALNEVARKHGMAVSIGNIRFQDESFHCKLTAALTSGTAAATTGSVDPRYLVAKADLARYAFLLDFADVEKTYTARSLGEVKIVGYVPRRREYPFLIQQSSSGKYYKFTEAQAKELVGMKVASKFSFPLMVDN